MYLFCVTGYIDIRLPELYDRFTGLIFGQADTRGGPAFVALPRLRPLFYGDVEAPNLYQERALKEAVH
jgi:predicted Zn-dependent protease